MPQSVTVQLIFLGVQGVGFHFFFFGFAAPNTMQGLQRSAGLFKRRLEKWPHVGRPYWKLGYRLETRLFRGPWSARTSNNNGFALPAVLSPVGAGNSSPS